MLEDVAIQNILACEGAVADVALVCRSQAVTSNVAVQVFPAAKGFVATRMFARDPNNRCFLRPRERRS